MTKQEFIYAVQQGSILVADACVFDVPQLTLMARAAKEKGFTLPVTNAASLTPSQIAYLGSIAPGHVSFPDAKVDKP